MSYLVPGRVNLINWKHTLFTHSEELVGIPRNDTTWKSSPAPFYHAAQDLDRMSLSRERRNMEFTIGSVSRSSCIRYSPCSACPLSKKFRINVRAALGSDVGRYGRIINGISSARVRNTLACVTPQYTTCMPSCAAQVTNLRIIHTS